MNDALPIGVEICERDREIMQAIMALDRLMGFICSNHPESQTDIDELDGANCSVQTDTFDYDGRGKVVIQGYPFKRLNLIRKKLVASGICTDGCSQQGRQYDDVTVTQILKIVRKGRDSLRFEVRSNWKELHPSSGDGEIDEQQDHEFEYLAVYFGQKRYPLLFPRNVGIQNNIVPGNFEDSVYDVVLAQLKAIVPMLTKFVTINIPSYSEDVQQIVEQTGNGSAMAINPGFR